MGFLTAFRTSSHLLILVGTLSLTLTEGNLPFIFLTVLAVLSSWLTETNKQSFHLNPFGSIVLLAVSFIYFTMDGLWLADSIVSALVHLLILIQVIKLLQEKADRDYLQLYAISFVQLVVTSVLTTNLLYIFFFLTYILLGSWSLILIHLKKEAIGQPSSQLDQTITRSFFLGTLAINLLVLGVTVFLFLFFPRLGMGLVQKKFTMSLLTTGFSEEVHLGAIGLIKESFGVVMRVELLGERPPPGIPLLWRGVALDHYTGQGWKLSSPERRFYRSDLVGNGGLQLPFHEGDLPPQGKLLRQRFTLNEMDTRVLFGIYPILSVTGKFPGQGVSMDVTRSLYTSFPHYLGFRYLVNSVIPNPDANITTRLTEAYPSSLQGRFMQLPPLSSRIHELAKEIVQGASGPQEMARKVEAYLKANYQYTLKMEDTRGREPVENFLLHTKKGHCEYFASAMVILLRMVSVPARLVNGFLPGEWNEFGRYYLVRNREAHSWVEVYLPGQGWVSFDPTPSREERPEVGLLSLWQRYLDALQLKWYSYVIDYALQDQLKIVRGFKDNLRSTRQVLADRLDHWFHAFFRFSWRETMVPGIALLLAIGSVSAYWAFFHLRGSLSLRGLWGQKTSFNFYKRMLEILAKKGYSKLPETTPWEFCIEMQSQGIKEALLVDWITRKYYGARFGKENLSTEELIEVERCLRILKES